MAFRILSLDGGGIRGVMEAVILAEVEQLIDRPLNQYFHLIAGTSTGSILAAAIATGRRSQEIIELYRQKGKNIFPYTSRWSLQRLPLILQYGPSAPKFSDQGLINVLKEQFGSTQLSDIDTSPRLLIIAYDTIDRETIVFKSWQRYKPWANSPLWEVCVSSSSAPTYFPAHLMKTQDKNYSLIDGGVGANNPSSCAIAEAIRLDNPIQEISLLSIGTGNSSNSIPFEQVQGWGMGQWIWEGRLIQVLSDASGDVNDYITRQVMSSPELEDRPSSRYLRLQPTIKNELIDDATDNNINRLIDLAQTYIRENQEILANFVQSTRD
ncbi:CBASS cGAMP-activated phospholipase [Argonema antarcticum]|uniref:CBASS cGAMP-activated phospholipase n=1 Tax=Argonema antarcticum TaxID=2942763 RepID=UPI002013452C|nr:CBASS cGAMP-activated phospholipase [Argonema antarcticum]MCL1472722.1 patatin-like phospholipase family protein [Argonema antarcticum A004/B2]